MKKLFLLGFALSVTSAIYAVDNESTQPKTEYQPSIAVPVSNPDDPAYHVQPGTGYDGVVEIYVGESTGTGALLSTGRHILTAAHLWDGGSNSVNPNEVEVVFNLPSGPVFINASKYTIHAGYSEDDQDLNNDIAIIELSEIAPAAAERYEIYRGSNEVGQVAFKIGYGYRGTGLNGQDETEEVSVLRFGQNRYDAIGDIFNENFFTEIIPGSQLIYDFDNGNAVNDACGEYFGIIDLGLGANEVNTTQGDSGGPSFINNQVVGITSYGISPVDFSLENSTDVDEETNSTYGEFSSDTRVSFYATWIDSVAGTSPQTSVEHFELY